MLSGQYLDSCSRSRRVLVGGWCSPAQVLACRQIFVNCCRRTHYKSVRLMTKDRDNDEQIRDLIETGTDITGGAVGAAAGLLIGGPAGALALRYLASEFTHRVLGQREEARVGAVLEFAAEKIQQNIEQGQQVRQ